MSVVLRIHRRITIQEDDDFEAQNNPVALQVHHHQPYNTDANRMSNVEDRLVQVEKKVMVIKSEQEGY